MSMLSSLDITGSALTAERFRMNTILQNLANINTTRTPEGEPYRRKQLVFTEQPVDFKTLLAGENAKFRGGVKVTRVVESDRDFTPVYDPTHPDADGDGYVLMPNVNRTEEQVDLMAASRAYEANLAALSVIKATTLRALEIGK